MIVFISASLMLTSSYDIFINKILNCEAMKEALLLEFLVI